MASVQGPAGGAVLATPELLEWILSGVDMRTLLVSVQRVCRGWRDMINTSPRLQRTLFFQPDPDHDPKTPVQNPLLAELFPPWFGLPGSTGNSDSENNYWIIPRLPITERTEAFYRLDASWRSMHIQQPPMHYLGEWHCTRREQGEHTFYGHDKLRLTHYASGVRMAHVYALVNDVVDFPFQTHWAPYRWREIDRGPLRNVSDVLVETANEMFENAGVVFEYADLDKDHGKESNEIEYEYTVITNRWFDDGGCLNDGVKIVCRTEFEYQWD